MSSSNSSLGTNTLRVHSEFHVDLVSPQEPGDVVPLFKTLEVHKLHAHPRIPKLSIRARANDPLQPSRRPPQSHPERRVTSFAQASSESFNLAPSGRRVNPLPKQAFLNSVGAARRVSPSNLATYPAFVKGPNRGFLPDRPARRPSPVEPYNLTPLAPGVKRSPEPRHTLFAEGPPTYTRPAAVSRA
jgi:hypothetical protein